MQKYVLVYVRQRTNYANDFLPVLVIEKQKPLWQAGLLNLVGGKVEEGEDSWNAAVRELREETGLIPLHGDECHLMGVLAGTGWHIDCYSILVEHTVLVPQEGEVEKVFWMNWAGLRNDPRLIPNLKVIIPLMQAGIKGWVIKDDKSVNGDRHEFSIEVAAK